MGLQDSAGFWIRFCELCNGAFTVRVLHEHHHLDHHPHRFCQSIAGEEEEKGEQGGAEEEEVLSGLQLP